MEKGYGCRNRFRGGVSYDCSISAIDNVSAFFNTHQENENQMETDGCAEDQKNDAALNELGQKETESLGEMNLETERPGSPAMGDMGEEYACPKHLHLKYMKNPHFLKRRTAKDLAEKTNDEIKKFQSKLSTIEHWLDKTFGRLSNGVSQLQFIEQRILKVGQQHGAIASASSPIFLSRLPCKVQLLVPLLLAKCYADLAHSLEPDETGEDDSAPAEEGDATKGLHELTAQVHDILVEAALAVLRLLDTEFPNDPDGTCLAAAREEYMSVLSLFTSLEPGPVLAQAKYDVSTSSPAGKSANGILSYLTDSLAKMSMFSNSGADDTSGDIEKENKSTRQKDYLADSPFFSYLDENAEFFKRFAITPDCNLYTELDNHPPSNTLTNISKPILDLSLEKLGVEFHVAREHRGIVDYLNTKADDPLENVCLPLESLYDRYRAMTDADIVRQLVETVQGRLRANASNNCNRSGNRSKCRRKVDKEPC